MEACNQYSEIWLMMVKKIIQEYVTLTLLICINYQPQCTQIDNSYYESYWLTIARNLSLLYPTFTILSCSTTKIYECHM